MQFELQPVFLFTRWSADTVVNFDHLSQELAARGIETSSDLAKELLDRHSIATLSTDSFGLPDSMLSLRLASCYLDMEQNEDSARLLELRSSGIGDDEFMSEAHHPKSNAAIKGFAEFLASLSL